MFPINLTSLVHWLSVNLTLPLVMLHWLSGDLLCYLTLSHIMLYWLSVAFLCYLTLPLVMLHWLSVALLCYLTLSHIILYWLSVALINLTLPFLACLFLSFNLFIKAPTSHIRSILLWLLDVPGCSKQSYIVTQSNSG